jgi:ubiquinone/menaquinone biosynthesis C-methylase UbiE
VLPLVYQMWPIASLSLPHSPPDHRPKPRQEAFAALMREAGFQAVTYENLAPPTGVVAIHSGFKL